MTMTDGEARRWEWKLGGVGAMALVFAILAVTVFPATLAGAPAGIPAAAILGVGAVVAAVLAVMCGLGVAVHHRYFFSTRQRLRRDLGGPEGWLDIYDLRETSGEQAVLEEAQRFWGHPVDTVQQAGWEVGEPISGRWPVRGKTIRAPFPRSAIAIGPQGAGKSQLAIPIGLDLPAATVITSTKTELYDALASIRAEDYGPIYVFDPLGLTGGAHNFPFDPVWGCLDAQRTDETAQAMIRGASISKRHNETFWADIGREILRCYLLAAALENMSSFDVQRWTHKPEDPEPVDILVKHEHLVPEGWLSLYRSRINTNVRQRDGYFATVSSCMDYLGHPGGAAAVRAPRGGRFDMRLFLQQRCTLFIIGDKSVRGMAAMMTALTESLAYDARAVAKAEPLGEPLVMLLDEVTNLTPVDLARWVTELRGWGVMPFAFIQSRSQLDSTYGEAEAEIIWENMITKIVLGSLGDDDFLESMSRLVGERRIRRVTDSTSRGAQGSIGLERVAPLHVIRSLPRWHALYIGAARHAAVVAFEPGFQRLAREYSGASRRPAWTRWWRHPIRATLSALELERHR